MKATIGALDILVAGLFDYAGTHPPAGLPLEEALKTSAAFPKTLKRPGLVGCDLVAGVDQLSALSDEALRDAGFEPGRRLRFCALGRPIKGPNFDAAAELQKLKSFNSRGGGRSVVSYEAKVEMGNRPDFDALKSAVVAIRSALSGQDVTFYIEPDLSGTYGLETLRKGGALLAELNAGEGPRVGLKVRGAGPTAVDNAVLAKVILETCRRDFPLKATAGFHHPFGDPVNGAALGFLNVLAALIFEKSLGPAIFPESRLRECLGTADPADYVFDEGLTWRGIPLPDARLRETRQQLRFSIGSCSLQEPDAELEKHYPA